MQNSSAATASGLEMVQCHACKRRHLLQRKDLPHHLQSIAARSDKPSTTVDKATATRVLASRKQDFKMAKKANPLPPAIQVSTVSATPKDTSKPKAKQPKAPRTTPRYNFKQPEVPELVTEALPSGWKNPEPPPVTFAAIASISISL